MRIGGAPSSIAVREIAASWQMMQVAGACLPACSLELIDVETAAPAEWKARPSTCGSTTKHWIANAKTASDRASTA
jgi:hypothetical protein